MSDKYKLNVITGKLDLVEHIPEVTSDPSVPRNEDAWVRRNGSGGAGIADGTPIGLLLALTYQDNVGGSGFTYDFNYRTQEGTTIRIPFDSGIESLTITSTTGDYTVLSTDELVVCNSTTSGTITLPSATGSGTVYKIKNVNVGSWTVDGDGTETIDGETTQLINQYECLTLADYTSGAWAII